MINFSNGSFTRVASQAWNFWGYGKNNSRLVDLFTDFEMLYLERLYNIYLSRFSYKNLPAEMDTMLGNRNLIDAMLFFSPSIAFFYDEKYGVQVLPTTGEYKFNLIGRPVEWYVKGFNGFSKKLNEDNSVIMFNDEACSIPFLHLLYEVRLMHEVENTTRQNIMAQRQPFIVEGDEEQQKSAKEMFEKIKDFAQVIFRRRQNAKNAEPIETKVLSMGVPLIAKDTNDLLNEFMNRALTYLGINNIAVQDKRERLITAEASANDMLIQMNYTSAYNQRNIAVDKVNKKFGLNIEFSENELKTLVSSTNNEYSASIATAENRGLNNNKKEDNNGQ